MIVGKNSALKGFGLFFYALVTILVLICTVNVGGYWCVCGVLNTLLNAIVVIKLFRSFSENSNK